MYCGSCLRDNTLATELMARGHDVSLLPVYTPDAHRRGERQRRTRLLRRHQRVPAAARAAPPEDARRPRLPLGHPRGHQGGRRAWRLGRAEGPGRADRLHAARARRASRPRRSRKLVRYLAGPPPFDLVVIPIVAPHRPRRSPQARARPPRRLHAARRGPVPGRPVRGAPPASRWSSSRGTRRSVDAFIATSDYYAAFMAGYLGIDRGRIHMVPLGIHLDGLDPAPRPVKGPFTVGYLARIAPEKGLHLLAEAYRSCFARSWACAAARLEAAGYLAPEHRGYLAAVEAKPRDGGTAERVPLPRRRWTARPRSRSCTRWTCCRCPAPTPSPRASTSSRPWRTASPGCSRATAPSRRCIEKTGGGLLFEPNDVRRPRRAAAVACARSRRWPASWAGGGPRACARHYTAARMAERSLEVFKRSHRRGLATDGARSS